MSNKANESDSVTISKEDFDELTLLVKNIQIKSAKIEESQTQGYKWNLQHHENLKKVITSLNQITKLLQGTLPPNELLIIEAEENISKKNQTITDGGSQSSSSTKTKRNFHEMVLKSYNGKETTPELQKLFRSLNDDSFSELKDSSAFILLKVAVKWLSEEITSNQQEKVNKSLAFLWGCKQDFRKMLQKRDSISDVKLALERLERLDTEGKLTTWLESESFPLTEEELCDLRLFLERCLVV